MSWIAILSCVVFLLLLLPLLPGLIELLAPTDIAPLKVLQEYDSNPMHFAEGFREFVRAHFSDVMSEQNHNGRLQDNTRYQLVGEKGLPQLDASGVTNKLLLSHHSMTLPDGELFEAEVYGRKNIVSGERSNFRAVLADGALTLRDQSSVLRWAHADGELEAGRDCRLFGRATSRTSIMLAHGVEFERLHAPKVMTVATASLSPKIPAKNLTTIQSLPDVKMQSGRRWVLNGHMNFPANHYFDGDIVTGTTAHIGHHAHIKGSIKCNAGDDVVQHFQKTGATTLGGRKVARCEIGAHVRIDGSVISSQDLFIGEHCQIFGPVIAEGLLVIGAGTVIGSPEHPTTVTAPRIIIESGCTIYGTVWASEGGLVRMAGETEGVAA